MLEAAVRNLFRRSSRSLGTALTTMASAVGAAIAPDAPAADQDAQPGPTWPPERLTLAHRLWGSDFIFPGGEIETLRLVRPLGMSAASSLLLVGAGSGGPAIAITRNFGAWVTAMEADAELLAATKHAVVRSQLAKKITITAWAPDAPAFVPRSHHHCLALEPLHDAQPEPILDGLARALKPGGQLVMTALAAPKPLDPHDRVVRRWAELERCDPTRAIAPVAITRMLGRVGLDVRVAEDMSKRHLEHALLGWRVMLRDLAHKPSRREAVPMVAEAELWLLRRRLIRDGRLRMMRWHALSRLSIG